MSVVAVQGFEWTDHLDQNTKARRYFSLETDLPQLIHVLKGTPGVRLKIIDLVSAYWDKTDSPKNADIRRLLAPLRAQA